MVLQADVESMAEGWLFSPSILLPVELSEIG